MKINGIKENNTLLNKEINTLKENSLKKDEEIKEIKNNLEEMNIKIKKVLEQLECTISLEIMEDPVITPYGFSYEDTKIKEWLESHTTDPLCENELNENQFNLYLVNF